MIPAKKLESFESSLISGQYNLLLGSGISLDSTNGHGDLLPGAEALRTRLCSLKNVKESTSLQRVYQLLSENEITKELTDRFANCNPHSSLMPLPMYLWRRLFTFNIDDCIERLYESTAEGKQSLFPLNFDASFEPTPDLRQLQSIHLHGWVRLAHSGYVFSHAEYMRLVSTENPWMHLLAEILATEPFIIAGTSLNEVDLEYYLSHRSPATPRRGRGPSLLIEPAPDDATRADCERHGLVLVEATFAQFLAWLRTAVPAPPTVHDLIVPDVGKLFPSSLVSPQQMLTFFSDFRLVEAADRPRSPAPSPFLYGRAPRPSDLDQHLDIPRQDVGPVTEAVERMLRGVDNNRMIVVMDEAGVGKTTVIHRVGHDFARKGRPVLAVQTTARIDPRAAADCLSTLTTPALLIVDGLADHAEQLSEIVQDVRLASKIVVLASERAYRREFVELVFGDWPLSISKLKPLTLNERQQLIELLRRYGLAAAPEMRNVSEFANLLRNDPVAVAVCRILSDFKPIDSIVESLWSACDKLYRLPYICVSIARHCLSVGLKYSILQSVMGPRSPLTDLFTDTVPLRLADNAEDEDYVVPLNAVIAERVLDRAINRDENLVYDAFLRMAKALAPHVNRYAIMRRSPEARLATRLFDADKIAKPMLRNRTNEWYVACQLDWAWNSRYWEQRALLASESDPETALQYARHAVAIERHPFTLTTLGKLLFLAIERGVLARDAGFKQAFDSLRSAIEAERGWARSTVHPFATLFTGAARFIDNGGTLSTRDRDTLAELLAEARSVFPHDRGLQSAAQRVENLL